MVREPGVLVSVLNDEESEVVSQYIYFTSCQALLGSTIVRFLILIYMTKIGQVPFLEKRTNFFLVLI